MLRDFLTERGFFVVLSNGSKGIEEQRISRADRVGQENPGFALNLTQQETMEHRDRKVLKKKLAGILEEFGVDNTESMLDPAEASDLLDRV